MKYIWNNSFFCNVEFCDHLPVWKQVRILGGQVRKRVWKMTFVGLKFGQDLEDLRHTPIKNSQEYPPGSDPPPPQKKDEMSDA